MKMFWSFLTLLFIVGCSNNIPKIEKSYTVSFDQEILSTLDFERQELATIKIADQWYYVRQDGKAMAAISNDQGQIDPFQEGLARTRINGKIGFFDQALNMVLEPFYDYAFPFHNGVAEICVGCQQVSSGEGNMLDGGTWKRIDRSGLVLEE
ncbi:MAG: WG repeat-containing protein [Campylobacterales bacterium]|nr:WG repeat-containing protein [Campylobacterales bacterium]